MISIFTPAGKKGDNVLLQVCDINDPLFDLNSLAFVDGAGNPATPASGDRIITQNATGLQTIYFRNSVNTEWGYNVTTNYRGRTKQVWTKGGTIPAGTGFWYKRTGGEESLRIKFTAEQ